MAQPKDDSRVSVERMRALLARWLQSLELHARYLKLPDAYYWHVQPWPVHERPLPWVVRLARQKATELLRALEEHCGRGDRQFAVGLEQMVFLANLVGLQPAGRHVPLADPQAERREMLQTADTATREAPRPRAPRASARAARATRGNTTTIRTPRAASVPTPPNAAARVVIEDAVRLLQWGRRWHELGELISRLHGRPAVGDARRILRAHRAQIEVDAAQP
ncbi:MAG TPA: hypothetical protein VK130_02040 [Steroidobacteraceae bacterium]|nr:hypothetical protein [Steroidobacteraceae bacterium]